MCLLDEVPAPVIGEVLDAYGLDSAIAHEGDRVRRPDARVVAEQLLGLALPVPLRVGRSRTGPRGATLVRGPLRTNDLAHALRALAQGAGDAIDTGIAATDDHDVLARRVDRRIAPLE